MCIFLLLIYSYLSQTVYMLITSSKFMPHLHLYPGITITGFAKSLHLFWFRNGVHLPNESLDYGFSASETQEWHCRTMLVPLCSVHTASIVPVSNLYSPNHCRRAAFPLCSLQPLLFVFFFKMSILSSGRSYSVLSSDLQCNNYQPETESFEE